MAMVAASQFGGSDVKSPGRCVKEQTERKMEAGSVNVIEELVARLFWRFKIGG
jgi:hypothetical protein